MEVYLKWSECKAIVDEKGFEGFIHFIENKYPHLGLYTMPSTDWYYNKEYFCKFRGGNGDLLIFWENE